MTSAITPRSLLGALLLAAALPTATLAQQDTRAAVAPTSESRKAEVVSQKALQLEGDLQVNPRSMSRFTASKREIARLHLRAAELHGADDPRGEESLHQAAKFLHSFDAPQARAAMIKAADRALARGDVLTAAHRYMDAAWLVQHQKGRSADEVEMGRSYLGKAELLASSPLLSQEERSAIVARIKPASAPVTRVARAARP